MFTFQQTISPWKNRLPWEAISTGQFITSPPYPNSIKGLAWCSSLLHCLRLIAGVCESMWLIIQFIYMRFTLLGKSVRQSCDGRVRESQLCIEHFVHQSDFLISFFSLLIRSPWHVMLQLVAAKKFMGAWGAPFLKLEDETKFSDTKQHISSGCSEQGGKTKAETFAVL